MSFRFSERHIQEYYSAGYTVFRGMLPSSLIADLRHAINDKALESVRRRWGAQAQRLQPIESYDIDPRPFANYKNLPALNDALTRVLSSRHKLAQPGFPLGTLGVLLEPAESPWCTAWHRDWRDHLPLNLRDYWNTCFADRNLFNQVNCALYADDCTWVVPDSHLRGDLPREVAAFSNQPPRGPCLDGLSIEERELACLSYCRQMPGSVQLHLDSGDFALYRNTLWHLGNYVPYKKRATLHDTATTPEFDAWIRQIENLKANKAERTIESSQLQEATR